VKIKQVSRRAAQDVGNYVPVDGAKRLKKNFNFQERYSQNLKSHVINLCTGTKVRKT